MLNLMFQQENIEHFIFVPKKIIKNIIQRILMVCSHRFEMKMLLNLFLFIDHHVILIIRDEKWNT
jgi:hypothetical protein